MATTVPAAEQLKSYTDYANASNPTENLQWIRQAFMLNTVSFDDISDDDYQARISTPAAWGFEDTALGGSFAINMPAQFTEYADVTMGGDLAIKTAYNADKGYSTKRTRRTAVGSFGMGRYYYEMIHENAQYVTMAFGVKAFNSMTSFFGNFYDPRASQLVRTGRSTSLFFKIGQIGGTILSIPFMPIVVGSTLIKFLMGIPATKFSYFKPTMPLYFNAVNNILNAITANIGVHDRALTQQDKLIYVDQAQPVGSQVTTNGAKGSTNGTMDEIKALAKNPTNQTLDAVDNAYLGRSQGLAAFLPGIYSPYGGIDVYAVAGRAQLLLDAHLKSLQAQLDDASSIEDLRARLNNVINGNLVPATRPFTSLNAKLADYLGSAGGQGDDDPEKNTGSESMGYLANATGGGANPDPDQSKATAALAAPATNNQQTPTAAPKPTNAGADSTTADTNSDDQNAQTATPPAADATPGFFANWWSTFVEYFKADLHDGSGYVTFKVDYNGSIGESFSNSMRSSDLAEKINSMSSEARNARYDLADGNVLGGAVGGLINKVIGAVGDFAMGTLDSMHVSGVAALAGSAFVDIPKMYDSSSMSLPSQSFTIELRSWSGHRLSLLQNVYLPLAMLLAGVLPRSTGPQSFNGPFSCQLFSRGRMQVKDGLITDMSITRGTANVGWTGDSLPLGIDVTFTVTDFSSVMHMPILAQSGFYDKAALAIGGAADKATGSNVGTNVASFLVAGMYADDSVFADYLAILSGLSWQDQTYPLRRWSIYRDRAQLNYEMFKSPAHVAGWATGGFMGRTFASLVHGSDRP